MSVVRIQYNWARSAAGNDTAKIRKSSLSRTVAGSFYSLMGGVGVRKTLLTALMFIPFVALGDHLDVIQFELKEGCTLADYHAIADDFNEQWGKKNAYHGEVAAPIQSHDMKSYYWLGRSADAASFGKAYDTWQKESANPDSVAGKLSARFAECSVSVGRRGYSLH